MAVDRGLLEDEDKLEGVFVFLQKAIQYEIPERRLERCDYFQK
jgi:hypothetical protein